MPSSAKRTPPPDASFLAGRANARQREPSSRSVKVASIFGSVSRPIRQPDSRAGITRVSLTTSASPGLSRSGKSRTPLSSSSGVPPGLTISNRAASRGTIGRSAMRSRGRSNSNRSVRMTIVRHSGTPRSGEPGIHGHHREYGLRVRELRSRPGMTASLLRVGGHCRLDDLVGVAHRLAALDLVDVLHALHDIAPGGVLVVEEGRVAKTDEELAVAGIGIARARHRHRAAHVGLLVELGLELLAGAAGAGAMRTAGLRHEAV